MGCVKALGHGMSFVYTIILMVKALYHTR